MQILRLALVASLALNALGLAYAGYRWARSRPAPAAHHRTEGIQLFEHLTSSRARIVMLGDSLTDRAEWHELLGEPVVNRGVPGDTIRGVTARLATVASAAPQVIAVMVGINDLLAGRDVDACARDHEALLDALAARVPAARVVVQSVLPVRPPAPALAAEIDALNARLRDLCARRGCAFLDVHAALVGADGQLDPTATLDGVHLTGAAYVRWRDVLRPALVP